jgi:adenylate kinase
MGKVAPRFKNLKILNFAEVMIKVSQDKGYLKNATHDLLRTLPSALQNKIKEEAWTYISKQKEDVMIDTHAFVEHTGLFLPGIPLDQVRKLKGLCGLFCIDAPNETLRSRAAKDKARLRPEIVSMADLTLNNYRSANIAALVSLSAELDIPFYIIYNEDGKLRETADLLEKHMHDAFDGAKQ